LLIYFCIIIYEKRFDDLDSYLTMRIVESDGVNLEDMTVEYIHEQRVKKIYPRD
jgi:hypothetical protein